PAPRRTARCSVAGLAKLHSGLATAHRADCGYDPDLCDRIRCLPAPGDPGVTSPDQRRPGRRGGPIGPPQAVVPGLVFHPLHPPPTNRPRLQSLTVSTTTHRNLSRRLRCSSGGSVVHRLTPKIEKLSPKPSTTVVQLFPRSAHSGVKSRLEDRSSCWRHP